jgi:CDP-diacylglycerol--glycerol-3-phosphate 3-phosphatidyltransferase
MHNENKKIINIPNVLSFFRIILSLLLYFIWDKSYIIFSVLLVIGVTDVLDGYFARKFNQKTIFGAWLDSIADFIFHISLILCVMIYDFNYILEYKYFIFVIILLKILSLIICFIKYKKLGFLHTLGNKITGIILFSGICTFVLLKIDIVIWIGIFISIISSFEELLINICGKKYKENIRGIYELVTNKK